MKKYRMHNEHRQKIDQLLSPEKEIEEKLIAFLPIKILIGLLTIVPWITSIIFFVNFICNVDNRHDFINLVAFVLIQLINLAILFYFLTFIFKSKRIPEQKRGRWVLFFFLNPLIAIIPLWYYYILREDE
jgi:hypothetical protein